MLVIKKIHTLHHVLWSQRSSKRSSFVVIDSFIACSCDCIARTSLERASNSERETVASALSVECSGISIPALLPLGDGLLRPGASIISPYSSSSSSSSPSSPSSNVDPAPSPAPWLLAVFARPVNCARYAFAIACRLYGSSICLIAGRSTSICLTSSCDRTKRCTSLTLGMSSDRTP
jgi:hypothetical protein